MADYADGLTGLEDKSEGTFKETFHKFLTAVRLGLINSIVNT